MIKAAMVPGMRKANRRVHLIVRAKEKMEARDIFWLQNLGRFFRQTKCRSTHLLIFNIKIPAHNFRRKKTGFKVGNFGLLIFRSFFKKPLGEDVGDNKPLLVSSFVAEVAG